MSQDLLRIIHSRCQECGDCLLWTNACNSSGIPVMHVRGLKGVHSVRRLVLNAKGIKVPANHVATVTCGNARCLAHVEVWTRKRLQQRSSVLVSANVRRSAKIASMKRVGAKLTMEAVSKARAEGLTGKQFAEVAGISHGHACRVLRGANWRDYSNPFAGLMA